MYSCTIAENVNVTAPITTTLNTSNAAEMSVTQSGTTITATLTGDSGLTCKLTFLDGDNDSATLNPPDTQSCNITASTQVGPVPVTVTFTKGGTANQSGNSLKADNLAISVKDGPGGTLGVKGTGTLSADCTAM